MRPTISELREWDPTSYTAASEAATAVATALDTGLDTAVRTFDAARSWRGRTHDAAHDRLWQEHDHAGEVRNVLQMIADEAADAGTDLHHAREHVLTMVKAVEDAGYHVTEDDTGTLSVSHPDPAQDDLSATLAGQISRGLATIDELDDKYGTRLEGHASDLAAMVGGQPDITLPGRHPMDADDAVKLLQALDREQIRELVERMSPQDVRRLLQADPSTMGNLPGVPFEHRIVANEINIRNALVDEIQAGRGEGTRARTLRDMLTAVDDPTTGRGRDGQDGKLERQFITFVNTPRGRMVEMIGSLHPGTRSITAYVPGTGTTMDSAGGSNRKAATELARQTGGPVFLYLDGDLPADLVEAARTRHVAEMAPRLAIFGKELDVEIAEHSPGATTTFVGHSYGGSVVGSAEQLGLTPDRVIYASSAGTGIYDSPHPTGVDRYSLTFPGDLIHYSQSLPGNPHGDDPDSAPGVTRLDTGTTTIDGKTYQGGPKTHGGYWDDPSSTAFQNMVKVITGQEPDRYVPRHPDVPELPPPPPGTPLPLIGLYLFNDAADGDIDMPGPLPDIPFRPRR